MSETTFWSRFWSVERLILVETLPSRNASSLYLLSISLRLVGIQETFGFSVRLLFGARKVQWTKMSRMVLLVGMMMIIVSRKMNKGWMKEIKEQQAMMIRVDESINDFTVWKQVEIQILKVQNLRV